MAELSEDISALSMGGASAIAGEGFSRRLRERFAEMKLGIPEDEGQEAGVADGVPPTPSPREPLPKTLEEWQKQKRRHKHNMESKKHSTRSGKERVHHNNKIEPNDQPKENTKVPPVMEISIQTSSLQLQLSHPERFSDARGCPPSVASFQERGSLLSASEEATGAECPSSRTDRTANSTRSPQRPQSCLSIDTLSANGEKTDNSTHATGHSDAPSLSNVTLESLQLSIFNENTEEKQAVLKIHQRLEKEVQRTKDKAIKAMSRHRSVSHKLQLAEMERQKLQRHLKEVQDENSRLRSTLLRTLDEKKSDEAVDDMLDCMGAKIRALKVNRHNAKQR